MIGALNDCGIPVNEYIPEIRDCYIKLECGDNILQENGKPIKNERV